MTRDRLVGYLWPDSSEERARHALAQLLYGTRRELGEDVIQGDAVTLRLNASRLTSDIAEFREAITSRDLELAARLYTGNFLDGFFLTGCQEFDRWVEDTRHELAHQARQVLQTLATRCAEHGDRGAEADYLRRLSALSPLDSRVALALMQALVAVGDKASALKLAAAHQSLVRSELDADSDPEIEEFAARLRGLGDHGMHAASVPRSLPRPGAAETGREGSRQASPAPVVSAVGLSAYGGLQREWWRRAAAYLLGIGTVAAIGAVASMRGTTDSNRKWVLIADAENATGDAAFDRTMPVALAAGLAQSGRVYPVPPDRVQQALVRMRRPSTSALLDATLAREIAQREGVAVVAVPSVEPSGAGFDLAVRLIDPATGGVIALSTVRAAGRAQVMDALEELGRDIRRRLGESRFSIARTPAQLPLVTTASLDALKKFADGSRAFQEAKYVEADALWREAVALDSGFASAHANLGMLAYWTNRPSDGARYYARALSLADRLPERERLRIQASAEGWRGNRDGAVRLLRPYIASHPRDLDLLNTLAYHLLRASRHAEAEQVLLQVTALDTLGAAAFLNLATVQKAAGRYGEALVNYRRSFAIDPAHETANNNVNLEFGSTYVFNGQLDSARATFTRLLASPDALRQGRALRSLAFLDMYEGRFRSAADRLGKAADVMRATRAGVSEIRNRLLLAQALEMLDAEREARRQLQRATDVAMSIDAPVPILLWVGKALARAGDVRRADSALAMLRPRVQPDVPEEVAAYETLLGETLLARSRGSDALPHLRAGYDGNRDPHALESLAFGLAATGALDSAAARYAQLERERVFGTEGQHLTRLAAYWLGRVEEARANVEGARAAHSRFVRQWEETGKGEAGDSALSLVSDARARLARFNAMPAGR